MEIRHIKILSIKKKNENNFDITFLDMDNSSSFESIYKATIPSYFNCKVGDLIHTIYEDIYDYSIAEGTTEIQFKDVENLEPKFEHTVDD
jgi:hypothetical protein